MRLKPSSTLCIAQLFSFPACSKIPSLFFHIFTRLPLLYLYICLFFLIQTSSLHEELLLLLPLCSPLMLLFEVAGLCKRNTFTPFPPTHLSRAVCQQGSAASILHQANFYCSHLCLFIINFSKAAFLLH